MLYPYAISVPTESRPFYHSKLSRSYWGTFTSALFGRPSVCSLARLVLVASKPSIQTQFTIELGEIFGVD